MKSKLVTLQFAKEKILNLSNIESIKIYNFGLEPANFVVNNFDRELPPLANYSDAKPYELKSKYPFDLELELKPKDGIILVEYFQLSEKC
jgi:hypothetical protein